MAKRIFTVEIDTEHALSTEALESLIGYRYAPCEALSVTEQFVNDAWTPEAVDGRL